MADNLTLQTTVATAPSGSVIATDDVSSVHFQKVKIDVGADGVSAPLGNSNPIPVSDAGSTLSVDDGAGSLTVDNAALSVTGGGVEASALRVTLANDSTGVLSVDDNGGSLTVDGTVAISGTVTVGSHAVTNAGTFAVQESGAALTALQLLDNVVLAEDAAHASGDSGVMALAVRRDANTTLADTTGDYAPLQVDASGSLKVAIISGAGSGGSSATDDAAFTAASGSGNPIMGFVTADSVDSGDVGVVAMTAARALHVAVQGTVAVTDNNSTLSVDDGAGSITVDNAGTFAVQSTRVGASSSAVTSVAGSATNVTLKASNANRRGLVIYNDSTATLYVKYGATATSADYTYQLQAGESLREELYTGQVDGIWASATGAAKVTELTV